MNIEMEMWWDTLFCIKMELKLQKKVEIFIYVFMWEIGDASRTHSKSFQCIFVNENVFHRWMTQHIARIFVMKKGNSRIWSGPHAGLAPFTIQTEKLQFRSITFCELWTIAIILLKINSKNNNCVAQHSPSNNLIMYI